MKKSKKGITLVELVICCAIIVMLGGACSAVLASGSRIFNQSSNSANAQLDADLLQNHMMTLIPSARNVGNITLDELDQAKQLTTGSYMFFDKDNANLFTLRVNGKNTTIRSIKEFEYSIIQAGDPDSTTARPQFVYTVTFSDGNIMNGGFVLSNLPYVGGSADPDDPNPPEDSMEQIKGKISEKPFCFNLPDDSPADPAI